MGNSHSNGNQSSSNNGSTGASNSNSQPNNGGNSGQSQNNGGNTNEKPIIPDELGHPNCPVCLSRVENRAYTNSCLHEFCFPCIQEWSKSHNKCPVCRKVYKKILYNIRSKHDYDEEEVREPPDLENGILVVINGFGILYGAPHTGLYAIDPITNGRQTNYNINFVGPHQRVVLGPISNRIVIVTPERLEDTLREMNARPHHPHHGIHPIWLRPHRHRHNHSN